MHYSSLTRSALLTLGLSASAVLFSTLAHAQNRATYIAQPFPDDPDGTINFEDGGLLTTGSSWIELELNDDQVSLNNYSLTTTDGSVLNGFTYNPSNSFSFLGFVDVDANGNIPNLLAQFSTQEPTLDDVTRQESPVSNFAITPERVLTFFGVEGVTEDEFGEEYKARTTELWGVFFVLADESTPLLPQENLPGGGFRFNGVPSGNWFDPIATEGFTYTMETPGSFFTEILGFPGGFNSPFSVIVDGDNKGSFSPGETYTFDGPGVTSFSITGISPLVDGTDPLAFPLQLAFSTPTATFTQVPFEDAQAPEPLTLLGAASAVGFGTWFKRKSRLNAKNK